jgi:hypothetical protein
MTRRAGSPPPFVYYLFYRMKVVYYESIKRELKIRGIYECRCDERLPTKKKGIYAALMHWVDRGTGTPKDRDEVNRREVFCECDG